MVIAVVHPQVLLDAGVEGADTEARSPFTPQAIYAIALHPKPIPLLMSDRSAQKCDRILPIQPNRDSIQKDFACPTKIGWYTEKI
ncbi:hypothetical protein [Vacuolonema iberomarrocanum]|uniref:hypothetical protein n=1 Tax=Vacuolonema iberomarrocanum TaxID=3454632 RepID=UPI0019EDD9A3|nr:hypothetical protein [filamentous cyanobacterium LEGE 07170]